MSKRDATFQTQMDVQRTGSLCHSEYGLSKSGRPERWKRSGFGTGKPPLILSNYMTLDDHMTLDDEFSSSGLYILTLENEENNNA